MGPDKEVVVVKAEFEPIVLDTMTKFGDKQEVGRESGRERTILSLLCMTYRTVTVFSSSPSFTLVLQNRSSLVSFFGRLLNTLFMHTVPETSVHSFLLPAAGILENPITLLIPS